MLSFVKMKGALFAVIFSIILLFVSASNPLKGHKLILVKNVGRDQILEFQLLDLDIWSHDQARQEATVHVTEDQLDLLSTFDDLPITILSSDLQTAVNREMKKLSRVKMMASTDLEKSWFDNYHKYEEIKGWYKSLVNANSNYMRFVSSIGRTHEGRDIFAVHIEATPKRKDKKQVWIQGLIHAREWISGAVVQYITKQLATSCNNNKKGDDLMDVEYIIIPVVNPDGYEHTWNVNRLWRKNMAPNIIGRGVDLNRNFNVHWGERGASKFPISDVYQGSAAASEPETQAIQRYFSEQGNIVGAIDWHSYSQLILYPYGWTGRAINNIDKYDELTTLMANAFGKNGRVYAPLQSYELYPTSGSATDWFISPEAMRNFRYTPYSLAIELPPKVTDQGGFLLDPKYIKSVGDEAWNAFKVFTQFVYENSVSRTVKK